MSTAPSFKPDFFFFHQPAPLLVDPKHDFRKFMPQSRVFFKAIIKDTVLSLSTHSLLMITVYLASVFGSCAMILLSGCRGFLSLAVFCTNCCVICK